LSGGYVFWIGTNGKTGEFELNVISSMEPIDGVRMIPLQDSSAGPMMGEAWFSQAMDGELTPQEFRLPKDTAVFVSSDGLLDTRRSDPSDPEGKKAIALWEEFGDVFKRLVGEHPGVGRKEMERIFFQELQRIHREDLPTDDVSLFVFDLEDVG
jgi:hypothetical protein